MNVCIDIQSAVGQRAGVGRYTKTLVQHLGQAKGEDDSLDLFYFDFQHGGTPFDAPGANTRIVRWFPGRIAQKLWQTVAWPAFDTFAGSADVYHFPNFLAPPLNTGKSVVTIHDMAFARFPQFIEERNLRHLSARIRDTVERADAVIAVSQFSADEIHDILGVDQSRIFAIHSGIDQQFRAPAKSEVKAITAELGLDRPYILTVGTVEPRKNIGFLIDVFERMTDFDGQLVIAGSLGWKYEATVRKMRESKRAADIRHLTHVDDTSLAALYAGAEMLAMPSFYEGFGFPPIEAMACGTPVISSRGGSLAEVLGEGAVLIDRFEIDDWVDQAGRMLTDASHRADMIEKGKRRAARYSWAETARQTWKVYEALA